MVKVAGGYSVGDDIKMDNKQSMKSYVNFSRLGEDMLSESDYTPEEDYVYKPVSETDPWFTKDYITVHHTSGGEFFIQRKDGTEPNNMAQTYAGPYFVWKRDPEYSSGRRTNYGIEGEAVIGKSYYGKHGYGKPKNQGLRSNRILEGLTTILRQPLGGESFFVSDAPDPEPSPQPKNRYEIEEARKKGIHLDKVAQKSVNLPSAIKINNISEHKYIHTTDLISLSPGIEILKQPNTNINALAPSNKKFGMKGRAPIITDQPNTKIDFNNRPIGG